MKTDPDKRTDWQLSLANILSFVFAVGLWMWFTTRSEILEQRTIAYRVLAACLIGGFVARHQKRRAVALLIALFMLIVGSSHAYLSRLQIQGLKTRAARSAVLSQIAIAMEMYSSQTREAFPLSTSIAHSSAEMHRLLMVPITANGRVYGPFMKSSHVRIENGVSHLTGALGGRLLWAKLPDGKRILIDTGADNLPGGTLDATGIYTPGPIDANGDGKSDGADDLTRFPPP